MPSNIKFSKLSGYRAVSFNFRSPSTGRYYTAKVLETAKGRVESITNSETGRKVARVTFERHEAIALAMGATILLRDQTPAAACPRCGGWTGFGGMSQHAKSTVAVLGRTGCIC